MKKPKISVIGAGRVGENVAYLLTVLELGDVYLFARYKEGLEPAKAKALDLKQMAVLMDLDVEVVGVSYDREGFWALRDSDIVVITAGVPRREGMSREDLLYENLKILKRFTDAIKEYAGDSIVIVVSNPVDTLTYATLRLTGFEPRRVIGMAGVLDSARFKSFVKEKVRVSNADIKTLVMGTHGDLMVPVMSHSFVGDQPIEEVLGAKEIDEIIEKTRKGGAQIVSLMGTSAYYAPAASVVRMVESIVKDRKRVMPCSVFVEGEAAEHYEVGGLCIGLPVVLGRKGVEGYELVNLSGYEKRELLRSAESLRELIRIANELIERL
ncbi:MAG: malate dehydrogenase [Aquificae bacterium]|nr:malate dehydrogenase [Aquificota bacterium]